MTLSVKKIVSLSLVTVLTASATLANPIMSPDPSNARPLAPSPPSANCEVLIKDVSDLTTQPAEYVRPLNKQNLDVSKGNMVLRKQPLAKKNAPGSLGNNDIAEAKVVAFDACHDTCLVSAIACIASSILLACPPCGIVCLGIEAACLAACNLPS